MDTGLIGLIVPLIGAGFAGMWWYMKSTNEARLRELRESFDLRLSDRDTRIDDLKGELAAALTKIESLNSIVGANTDALMRSAESNETMVRIIRDLMGRASHATVTDPIRPGD